jgi:hypothetical protein
MQFAVTEHYCNGIVGIVFEVPQRLRKSDLQEDEYLLKLHQGFYLYLDSSNFAFC